MRIKEFVKKYYLPMIGLILLIIFGVIGQVVNKGKKGFNNGETDSSFSKSDPLEIVEVEEKYDLYDNIEILGAQETDDNPWGETAGKFEMEDVGKCILLTPNTGMQLLYIPMSLETFSIKEKIHPWMSEISDGVGITVQLLDDEDNIVVEDETKIDNSDYWLEQVYSFSEYGNISKIQVLCNNGWNNDDRGDWLIVKFN